MKITVVSVEPDSQVTTMVAKETVPLMDSWILFALPVQLYVLFVILPFPTSAVIPLVKVLPLVVVDIAVILLVEEMVIVYPL